MAPRWQVALIGSVVLGLTLLALLLAAPAIHNRLAFGTFSTEGPPPRIDYCSRRYYPDGRFPNVQSEPGSAVAADLRANGQNGLMRIGTTPSGMPILANVMTSSQQAAYHTNVCTMVLWVETGPDRYLGYGLSGGP